MTSTSEVEGSISASAKCVCGKEAISVTLTWAPVGPALIGDHRPRLSAGEAWLSVSGPTGSTGHRISLPELGRLRTALEAGDWALVNGIHREYAESYCRECRVHYCRAHWQMTTLMDDGFYDCTMGTCPKGHEKKLDD